MSLLVARKLTSLLCNADFFCGGTGCGRMGFVTCGHVFVCSRDVPAVASTVVFKGMV